MPKPPRQATQFLDAVPVDHAELAAVGWSHTFSGGSGSVLFDRMRVGLQNPQQALAGSTGGTIVLRFNLVKPRAQVRFRVHLRGRVHKARGAGVTIHLDVLGSECSYRFSPDRTAIRNLNKSFTAAVRPASDKPTVVAVSIFLTAHRQDPSVVVLADIDSIDIAEILS